jgi:hypothetical protein
LTQTAAHAQVSLREQEQLFLKLKYAAIFSSRRSGSRNLQGSVL